MTKTPPSPTTHCWNVDGVFNRGSHRCPRLEQYTHCHQCPVYRRAGRSLLERPLPDDYQEELTRNYARSQAEETGETAGVLIFRLGCEYLGLPAAAAMEVLPMGVVHSVPGRSDDVFRGLIAVRGRLEPCFSLGALLGVQPGNQAADPANQERLVVAAAAHARFAFPASKVYGVSRYRLDKLAPPPPTLARARRHFTRGIVTLDGRDVAILDHEILYQALESHLE